MTTATASIEEALGQDRLEGVDPNQLTDHDVDRVIEQVKAARAGRDRVKQLRDARVADIDARAKELTEGYDAELERLEAVYFPSIEESVRRATTGTKERHIKYLSGRAGHREVADSVDFPEPNDVLAWAEVELPDAVEVKKSVAKKPVKEHIRQTGEAVPGAEYTPKHDKFYIE